MKEDIKKLNLSRLFFSNKLERLFDYLKDTLFVQQSSIFAKRLIIVPSPAIEQWLHFKLADELGIGGGLATFYLTDGVGMQSPSALSLTLWLADRLTKALAEKDPRFAEVHHYCAGHPKRIMTLAKRMAHHFRRYGLYGVESFPQSFQKQLWEESCQIYPPLTQVLQSASSTVHLFGHNHLPAPLFRFFEQQKSIFYLLSPCREFWSDLYLEAKGGDNPQPFLLSLGRVGRDMAKMVEESSIQTEEIYDENSLSATQQALLTLTPLQRDETIEIHAAPTRLREVEVLYHNLIRLGVSPKDILVMAPDICLYAPFLKAVFGELVHLDERSSRLAHEEVKAFRLLLLVHQKKWSLSSLKQLFNHPLCNRRWNVKQLDTIDRWMRLTGVRWGYDASYRKKTIGRAMQQGTWRGGCEQLLEALANEADLIDFPEAELLGELLELLDALYVALESLQKSQLIAREWAQKCLDLYEQFFVVEEGVLAQLLEPLLHEKSEQVYGFTAIYPLIDERLNQNKSFGNLRDLQVIRCDSMRPMRALPAKVICLLGMDHDAFPRYQTDSLDALQGRSDVPTQADLDRYLFLEALLSYRHKCLISYQGRGACEGEVKPPSSVLDLLLPHVKHTIHPLQSYDACYFNGELSSTSESDFALCLASRSKKERGVLFTAPTVVSLPKQESVISIADLKRLVSHPLRHYYNHISFKERTRAFEEDPLMLNPLTVAKLRHLVLQMPQQNAIEQLQKRGDLPTGQLFEAMAPKLLSQIIPAQTKRYELARGVQRVEEIAPNHFQAPSLTLQMGETAIHIVGVLDGVGDQNMILPDRGDFMGAIKCWPTILISQILGLSERWTFSKNQQVVEQFLSNPQEELEKLLSYYFLSSSQPSPLYPSVVSPLLEGKVDFSKVFDPALTWTLQTKELGEEVLTWQEIAESLYRGMKSAWF